MSDPKADTGTRRPPVRKPAEAVRRVGAALAAITFVCAQPQWACVLHCLFFGDVAAGAAPMNAAGAMASMAMGPRTRVHAGVPPAAMACHGATVISTCTVPVSEVGLGAPSMATAPALPALNVVAPPAGALRPPPGVTGPVDTPPPRA
jgi:hypothetical protein